MTCPSPFFSTSPPDAKTFLVIIQSWKWKSLVLLTCFASHLSPTGHHLRPVRWSVRPAPLFGAQPQLLLLRPPVAPECTTPVSWGLCELCIFPLPWKPSSHLSNRKLFSPPFLSHHKCWPFDKPHLNSHAVWFSFSCVPNTFPHTSIKMKFDCILESVDVCFLNVF